MLTWALVALSAIDFDHQLLPDDITLPLLWVGLLLSVAPTLPEFGLPVDSHSSIIGAAAGYLSLWSVYKLFKLLTGKEGMGYGDFKLLAALGAWLGWQMLPVDHPALRVRRRCGRHRADRVARPRPRYSDPFRPVSRGRRLDRIDVGR